MDNKEFLNLLPFLIASFVILLPSLWVDAQITKHSGAEIKVVEKVLPPIDRNLPKVFDTASFGLG